MRILITAIEAITYGYWDKLCDLKDINIWAVNEGFMDDNTEFELTLEEAKKLGAVEV